MRLAKRITSITLLLVMGAILISSVSQAVSKNRKAGQAYASAVENETIRYNKNMGYRIADMDGDGVKDLLISNPAGKAYVYSYKKGAVKTILEYLPEYDLCYNAKKKLFVENGEGDGAWHIFYKYKNGKLVEKFRLFTEYANGSDLVYKYRKAGEEAEEMTKDEFMKMVKKYCVENLQSSRIKLINTLRKL